ncbi:MAG TPA: tannase/feruloyl esterase family alpha/beta hydrolase [Bryobacteraceae bacterium]|nr:tannase/feruloyl esterase family alpha/beta hydrolase [Bryobacteraceae bacterium]
MFLRLVVPLAAAAVFAKGQMVSPQHGCASLLQFEAAAVEISKAEAMPASSALPSYCLVQGTINKRIGAAGHPFGIGFELRLPDAWSERFLFQGGGGMDGVVRPATGAVPISGSTAVPALARGFAVASTDSGHQGQGGPFAAPADSSFGIDQQARIDQAYGGFIAVSQLSRRIIQSYYGEPWKKSYFMGCSNGGRQALLAAQRFPLEFDGVLAVAPAARVGTATISSVWETIAFSEIAPKDSAGRPILSKAFSNGDLTLLSKAVAAACDNQDGVEDGLIFNTKACHFDPAVLACKGAKDDACLSTQQVSVLKKVFGGPKNSRGEALYSNWPYDTGVAAPGWRALKLGTSETATPNSADVLLMFSGLKGFFLTPPDPTFDPMKFNFDTDPARLNDTSVLQDSLLTFLSTFSGHGNKLMMIHGMSDPFFSAYDTASYYEGVVADNGGLTKTMPWVRFFEIPGMNHCGGGPALEDFDPLTALVDWTEKSQAPEHMLAKGAAFPGVSRPVCAYPSYPHYRGAGSRDEAANFECK